ncbi:hypothetical protein BN159_5149 [Streptomyces davaonensis JCM 4913]|uniref:Uncharacterized protein n=1 Tax=Streptomyces davaonensis (strain DSM 101723 / JCM 4913 / KCC S-0913 / 768) TaxID=1214101 RepID=K4R847_STRDJ|nr:hypothetical protein [Streptomyces davaonensis]CCK29528.1 hypothetical protein BN159_5149 [Streptomyces davaonensis JCM 4913]
MSTLLFVHGTGVRRSAYVGMLTLLRDTMAVHAPGARVEECYWGDGFGVPEGVGAGALPGAEPAQADTESVPLKDLPEDDRGALAWGLLYEDPLSALRRPEEGAFRGRVADRTGPQVARRARALAVEPPESLAALLADPRVREEFAASVTAVLDSAEGQEAVTRGLGPGELPAALATAVVAHLLGGAQRRGNPVLWSAEQRDDAVRALTTALGGVPRGAVDRALLRASWWTAQRFGVLGRVQKNRAEIMTGVHPRLGDVLKYLARGHQLRGFIKDRLARVDGPVVLLGHSLGGIAAVDVLIEGEFSGVDHLVTVGSQAAHLHEIGALPCLDPGKPLPEHFPAWTNFYDRRDLLGFPAAPVFPRRVEDVEINTKEPFPAAHSAYFARPDFQRRLAGILRAGA